MFGLWRKYVDRPLQNYTFPQAMTPRSDRVVSNQQWFSLLVYLGTALQLYVNSSGDFETQSDELVTLCRNGMVCPVEWSPNIAHRSNCHFYFCTQQGAFPYCFNAYRCECDLTVRFDPRPLIKDILGLFAPPIPEADDLFNSARSIIRFCYEETPASVPCHGPWFDLFNIGINPATGMAYFRPTPLCGGANTNTNTNAREDEAPFPEHNTEISSST